MEILEELALDLPQSLKTFLIPQPIHKIRALRKRLRIITRWSEIQDTVGWIGVVISQFYNADTVIRQWNGKDFKKFLSGLRDFQPHLMERVMLYWPGIPNVLMSTNRMKKNHADCLGLEPSEPHKMINFLPEGDPDQNKLAGIEEISIRSTLPIWRWQQNSCSLDASLLFGTLVIQFMPERVLEYRKLHGVEDKGLFDATYNTIDSWERGAGRTWDDWSVSAMTGLRNKVRALLKERQIHVTINSAVADTLPKIIPVCFRSPKLFFQYHCLAKGCSHISSDEGRDRMKKTTTPEWFHFPATNNSSTQEVWDTIVANNCII